MIADGVFFFLYFVIVLPFTSLSKDQIVSGLELDQASLESCNKASMSQWLWLKFDICKILTAIVQFRKTSMSVLYKRWSTWSELLEDWGVTMF